MFSCEIYEIFKSIFFHKTRPVVASIDTDASIIRLDVSHIMKTLIFQTSHRRLFPAVWENLKRILKPKGKFAQVKLNW